jgi:hypothetical protein
LQVGWKGVYPPIRSAALHIGFHSNTYHHPARYCFIDKKLQRGILIASMGQGLNLSLSDAKTSGM